MINVIVVTIYKKELFFLFILTLKLKLTIKTIFIVFFKVTFKM